jgi:hypothetical protein
MKPKRTKGSFSIPNHTGDTIITSLLEAIPSGWKGDYLKSELLTKYVVPDKSRAKSRREAAIEKWLSVEQRNRKTNQRLYLNDTDFGWTTSEKLLTDIREVISQLLGAFKPDRMIKDICITSGASTSTRRSPMSRVLKTTDGMHITEDALRWWLPLISGTLLGNRGGIHNLKVVPGNVLFTVPKTTIIDRPAAKEPDANLILQRAIGLQLRRRLLRVGIDLTDQSRNQHLAQVAVSKKLATVDLSSASDSVTRQLVISLLPSDWADIMFDVRSPYTTVDGSLHENEMISSMGNGFTFELETLIFYAVSRALCRRSGVKGTISVYGDDIIVPSRIVPRLKRVFFWLGFRTNPSKTFHKGPFRESCGGHYYNGTDVTPLYIRSPIVRLDRLILLLNEVAEWSSRGWGFIIDPEITLWWNRWKNMVPRKLRGGSDFFSSVALVTDDRPHSHLRCTSNERRTKLMLASLNSWHIQRLSAPDVKTSSVTMEGSLSVTEADPFYFGCDYLDVKCNIT